MEAITKPQKILAIMYELCKGHQKPVLYEDIVVAAFKRYPEEFQLRGYPEYPDSSDIHKPLYQMKRKGLVRSANKAFELTPRGLEVARQVCFSESVNKERLTKVEEAEKNRILASAAYRLFKEGRQNSILDTDFFEYLGVTVRTGKGDFLGRLNNVECAIEAFVDKQRDADSADLQELHKFLLDKFKTEIEERQ
jgi:hypothetical protein